MKLALPPSLKLPVLSCAVLLPVLFGAFACGSEAALPIIPNGGQASGGTSVLPMGGSAGSVAEGGTGTTPTAGTSSTPAAGTTSTGGAGGSSTGGAATGGSANAGAAGTAGMGGGSMGGSTSDLKETVGGPLQGAMLLGPCISNNNATVCHTIQQGQSCPPKNPSDPAMGGALTTNKTITLGGDPAKVYTITLHVQGEVEAKGYNNGMDQNSSAMHPKMDGFYVGGTPQTGDDYNVYLARVSSPKQDYFLNSIKPSGVSDHTTYLMDYTAKIKANGGATIKLTAADTNCDMIKNCGPTPNGTTSCAQPLKPASVEPLAISKNPTFDFTKEYNGQWIVLVVTDVTQD
jgi:hypothetical protein